MEKTIEQQRQAAYDKYMASLGDEMASQSEAEYKAQAYKSQQYYNKLRDRFESAKECQDYINSMQGSVIYVK